MKNKLILSTLILLFFAQCDRYSSIDFNSNNNTTEDLIITFYNTSDDSVVVEIPANTNNNYLINRSHVGVGKNFNCCPCLYQMIKIKKKSTSISIKKDINLKENWAIINNKSHFLSKVPKNATCTFEINSSDL